MNKITPHARSNRAPALVPRCAPRSSLYPRSSFLIPHSSFSSAGATLIELLAVLVIMMLLAAAAVPVIAPAMTNRQVREASRMVSGFFTGARNRALQTGRPVGVVLERMSGLNQACVTLSYAEVPPPYCGDSNGSTVTTNAFSQITGFTLSDAGWNGTVRFGDMVRFNYQGNFFQLIKNPSPPNSNPQAYDTTTGFYNQFPTAADYPWQLRGYPDSTISAPVSTTGLPFQIIRAPVKIAAGSVQLPAQAVIDLTCSGFDSADQLGISTWVDSCSFQPNGASDTSSVYIMFTPSGAVESVWCWASSADTVITRVVPTGPLHLMVGRRDMLPLPATAPPSTASASMIDPLNTAFQPYLNWQDLGNFWVSVNPSTGLISTTENSQVTVISKNPAASNAYTGLRADLLQARQLALESQRMGGSR